MRAATAGGGSGGKPWGQLKPVTSNSLSREQVLALLRAHKATPAQRFDVAELALFGSVAHDQAADDLARLLSRPNATDTLPLSA